MGRMLPILFNTDMVKALLDGRKTVTRRIMKPQPLFYTGRKYIFADNECPPKWQCCDNIIDTYQYRTGDILYVRETWQYLYKLDGNEQIVENTGKYYYAATELLPSGGYVDSRGTTHEAIPWRPSIHMPKEVARIWLKITDVRIERLQEITEEQIKAEGLEVYTKDKKIYKYAVSTDWWKEYHRKHRKDFAGNWWQDMPKTAKEAYSYLWNSTIKKSDRGKYGWEADPWVWVIEFERCEKPESGVD